MLREINKFNEYLISSDGRVFSLKGCSKRELKLSNRKGYLRVSLVGDNSKACNKTVHRLVAEAFVPKEYGKNYVNHIDGDKLNNNCTNLEWCTLSENTKHAYRINLMEKRKGSLNCNSKLSEEDILDIRTKITKGVKNIDLAREYRVSDGLISSIKTGRYWSHI